MSHRGATPWRRVDLNGYHAPRRYAIRLFDPVVIICDRSMHDTALAVRGVLESFCLQPLLYRCVQQRNVLDALAGQIPPSEYVVLACHGVPEENRLFFTVVQEVADQQDVWGNSECSLTPANIPDLVQLPSRTIVSLACGSGRDPVARAFLAAGCRAFSGPLGTPDMDAALMHTCAFFYHLLAAEHDPALHHSEREAAMRAVAFDAESRAGTAMFRYSAREGAAVRDGHRRADG